MAYRKLEVGDDVKIVKCNDWSGMFGEVLSIEGDFHKVRFHSWKEGSDLTHYFTSDKLLVSNGNPYANMMLSQEDEDSFFHDEEVGDSEIMQQLLQRVAKIEKQIANIVYGKVA